MVFDVKALHLNETSSVSQLHRRQGSTIFLYGEGYRRHRKPQETQDKQIRDALEKDDHIVLMTAVRIAAESNRRTDLSEREPKILKNVGKPGG